METLKAIVDAPALMQLLKRLKTFTAGYKNDIPAFDAIHLFEREGQLYGFATDRYRMVVRRMEYEQLHVGKGFSIVLSKEAISLIEKTAKKATGHVVLQVSTETSFDHPNGKVHMIWNDDLIELPSLQQEYPQRLYRIIRPDASMYRRLLYVNGKFLKDFALPGRNAESPMLLAQSQNGDVLYVCADEYEIGMIRRVNIDDNEATQLLEQWSWLKDFNKDEEDTITQ